MKIINVYKTLLALGSAAAAIQPAYAAEAGETGSESTGLKEIVVTAQRREQRLTEVPISITAATAGDLAKANITDTRELALVTPGLILQSTGPWLQPAIRGVTSQATTPGSEQNVATYVDGVYQPFAVSNAFELPDVERIEVLKGPQGTLFGRNATGGAIQVITKKPTFETTGKISGSYGRFHDTELGAYLSMPVTDTIAASIAGSHRSTDGWNHNLLDNGRLYGAVNSDIVRGKILANIGDSSSLLLSAFYSQRKDGAVSANSLYLGNGTARRLGITPLADRPFTGARNYPSMIYTKNWGVNLRGEFDTGIGTITTTSAYLDNKFHLLTDGDASPAPLLQYDLYSPYKTYSQEVVLASKQMGRFSFVTGAYAYYSKAGYVPGLFIYVGNNLALIQRFKTTATSYAGFAEGTFEVTDRLTIIGGARYTYERRWLNNNFATAPDIRRRSFQRVTPRASITYELADHANVYFTYSHGFKSGQWDVASGTPKLVEPEILKAYEIGFKSAGRILAVTASAFYSDYGNLQNQFLDPTSGVGSLENAGAAEIYGAELSVKAQVTDQFSVTAQGAYTHAEYTEYRNASVTIPATDANGVPIGGNITVGRDLSGFTLARAPRLSGNVALDYEKEFDSGTFRLSSLLYYSSSYAIENGGRIKQPKYAQLNANASWTFKDSGIKIGVYGKNLTNRTVFLASSILPTGDLVSYQEPRSYGVNFEYQF